MGLDSHNAWSDIYVTWLLFVVGLLFFVASWILMYAGFGNWGNQDGLSASQVAAMDFGVILLPLGWILIQSSLNRLLIFQSSDYRTELTIAFLIFLIILSIVIGFVMFFYWQGVSLLTMDESASEAGLILLSVYIFIFCISYFILLTLILRRICLFAGYFDTQTVFNNNNSQYVALSTNDGHNNNNNDNSGYGSTQGQHRNNKQNTSATSVGSATTTVVNGNSSDVSERISKSIEYNENGDKKMEYFCIVLYFIIIMPGLLFLNGVLPSDWDELTPSDIISYNESEGPSWTINIPYDYNGNGSYMKLFGDLIIYFGFIVVVSLISWIALKNENMKFTLRRRVMSIDIIGVSMSLGQLLFTFVWFCMMFSLTYYWFAVHAYEDYWYDDWNSIGRGFGILSIIFLSFMFFTVSRIRLWYDVFGLSSDHLIYLHRIFAYCMLICSYTHFLCMIIYFATNGDYSLSDNFIFVGTLPFTYNSSNFTIPMAQVFLIFFVPIAYFACASSYMRNKFFEIFYAVHVYSAIVFILFIFFHATQSWRYMLPCLMLYFIDRCLRFYNSTNNCKVDLLETYTMDNIRKANERSITQIGFSIAKVEKQQITDNNNNNNGNNGNGNEQQQQRRGFYGNLDYKMGQFCYINIPAISTVEWHPFTVSSGPYDKQSTFHIRSMGDDQFSGKLCELANRYASGNVGKRGQNNNNNNTSINMEEKDDWKHSGNVMVDDKDGGLKGLEIHIDGPYGIPFEFHGYDRIVLVAGGIGITPCHSIIRGMMQLVKEQLYPSGNNRDLTINSNKRLPFVHLIWIVQNAAMFDVFKNTWKEVELLNSNEGELFTLDFYHSRPNMQDAAKQQVYRQSAQLTYKPYKPDLDETLKFLDKSLMIPSVNEQGNIVVENDDNDGRDAATSGHGGTTQIVGANSNDSAMTGASGRIRMGKNENALVFCCGPPSLSKACEIVATKYDAHYYNESFDQAMGKTENEALLIIILGIVLMVFVVIVCAIAGFF